MNKKKEKQLLRKQGDGSLVTIHNCKSALRHPDIGWCRAFLLSRLVWIGRLFGQTLEKTSKPSLNRPRIRTSPRENQQAQSE